MFNAKPSCGDLKEELANCRNILSSTLYKEHYWPLFSIRVGLNG